MNVVARRLLALAVLALLHAATATALAQPAAGGAQVLAPGEPQLTQQMVDRVTTLLGDTVGQPLNAWQRDRTRTLYVGYWRARNRDEMQAMLDLLDLATVLDALPNAQWGRSAAGLSRGVPAAPAGRREDRRRCALALCVARAVAAGRARCRASARGAGYRAAAVAAAREARNSGSATPSSTPAVAPVTRSHVAVPAAGVAYTPRQAGRARTTPMPWCSTRS